MSLLRENCSAKLVPTGLVLPLTPQGDSFKAGLLFPLPQQMDLMQEKR